jgi:hypothetical protein
VGAWIEGLRSRGIHRHDGFCAGSSSPGAVACGSALFSGNGTKDDADLVLVDLAQFSRYYDTANLTDAPAALAAATQRRAVMQRIMDALAFSGREPQGLLSAVLGAPPINEENEP